MTWENPSKIASTFQLNVRALHRHAHATGLLPKRNSHLREALGRLIEKGITARRVSPSVAVQAIVALSKINGAGVWVDRSETVDLNRLFERMSDVELEEYAKSGALPTWFEQTVGVASCHPSENVEA